MQILINHSLAEISAKLLRIQVKLGGDLEPVMSALADILENSIKERIDTTKQAPDGSAWAPLKPSTLKAKKGRGSILINEEKLWRGITSYATASTAVAGSDRQYAIYHQYGTAKMSARPIFGISDEDKRVMGEHLNDWLEGVFND